MILKLDIDTMRVAELITLEDLMKSLVQTDMDMALEIEKTINTLGLAIISQADHYCDDIKSKQLFILAVTHIANKIATTDGSYFSTRTDEDDYDDDDE